MRLRTTLLNVAMLVSAGCGGATVSTSSEFADAGGDPTSSPSTPTPCGGCDCASPPIPSATTTPAQACEVASGGVTGDACDTFCKALNDGTGAGYYCTLPPDYQAAYNAAADAARDAGAPDPDAGDDASADAGPVCPSFSGTVTVTCGFACLGRRTEGIAEPAAHEECSLGPIFAGRAYLEEVSVHAFARLERELEAHGAPPTLLRDARRARRDEIRHTAAMTHLARRFGSTPESPVAPETTPVRSRLEIALENAVEGCIRETYGAVIGLIEARESTNLGVARTMHRIATDECRHAELAWEIKAWLDEQLTAEDRDAVSDAMRAAIASLANEGDARVVEALDREVWLPRRRRQQHIARARVDIGLEHADRRPISRRFRAVSV